MRGDEYGPSVEGPDDPSERPDNGARALAERELAIRKVLRAKDPDSCLWMDGPDEHAAAILANGAVFKTAEEYEEILVYIDGLSTALSDLVLAAEAQGWATSGIPRLSNAVRAGRAREARDGA